MNIYYVDEYGTTLHALHDVTMIPNVAEAVIINEEDWVVESRVFYPQKNAVVITLAMEGTSSKASTTKDDIGGRLTEVKNSIIKLANRQDVTEKKVRAATEQIGSVRKHINTQIQKESKQNDS